MIAPTPTILALCMLLTLNTTAHAQYVGSKQCASCHQQAFEHWQQSHHWQAMQSATDDTVLGDFNDATFTYGEVTSTFYRKDGKFFVRTDNAEGAMQDFAIDYTFGFYPLQQYLIGFDDGRYQALSIAWDSRPASEGGQRWFHLYPDEVITHDDPLHWTGAFQNWNSRCASCHSTDLQKHYDQSSDSYQSTWAEINVGCEACHGAGSEHVQWAAQQQADATATATSASTSEQPQWPNKGLSTQLAANSQWQAGVTPRRQSEAQAKSHQQLDACSGCHSRRQELAHAIPGHDFLDQYSPSLLSAGLYFPDGQINDEVYVYGSFAQSKMHAAGVVCSNCHEPHSLQLRAKGNALCSQCHDAATFDSNDHHHHPANSAGAQCVNCHMPERDYMVVDPRRDHRFGIPQPMLSELFATPNACTGCHQERDNAWAKQALQQWYGHQPLRDKHTATLAIARADRSEALRPLLELARDEQQSAILRASALQESERFLSTEALATATEQLYSDEGLLRMAAVRVIANLPPEQRLTLLQPLLEDPVKAVRVEIASALAPIDPQRLPAAQQQALESLFEEYLEAQKYSADMPSTQMNLGAFYRDRGQARLAEQAYLHALKLSPGYLPAMLNLADFYRHQSRDDKAKTLLQQALAEQADWAPAHHAMGLLLVRQQQLDKALPYLQQAAQLSPQTARYSYVYAVALHSAGQVNEAIAALNEAARNHPQNREIQAALKAYQQSPATP